MRAALVLAMMLAYSTMASAHVPARCDPAIDRFVEAHAGESVALDEYYAWLEPRKDHVYDLTKEEAADLVRMIRDSDVARLEATQAMIALFECIG